MERERIVAIDEIPREGLESKFVLVRVDYNVPLLENETGALEVADDTKIKLSLETIRYLKDSKAKVVLCSHLGRPEGKYVQELSLSPAVDRLRKLEPDTRIDFCSQVLGKEVHEAKSNMKNGDILLLENLRFCEGEEQNDAEFAKRLAEEIDIYVNEAFSASHRGKNDIYKLLTLLSIPQYFCCCRARFCL